MVRARNDTLGSAILISIVEALKEVNTVLPGIVEEYDADARIASVRGAINLLMPDGRQLVRPLVQDAPVVFPEAGGYSIRYPLAVGDSVLILFSQRGLDSWKRVHALSAPGLGPLFSENDAIVLAGFGAAGNSAPAVDDALVLNGPGGYLAVRDNVVETDMSVVLKAEATSGSLPTAGSAYEGRMVHLRTATGTQLWFCHKDTATTWAWAELTG